MIIDFESLEATVIPNFRGGEKTTVANMFVDNNNKIMMGKLEPLASIGMHTHDKNSEIIYILSGEGKCLYDDDVDYLKAGFCHYCPMGHSHSLINTSEVEDLLFFAVIPEHQN